MTLTDARPAPDVVDVIGIGFGPANLGFAVALDEARAAGQDGGLSAVFVEDKAAFSWHPGMMLPGATMQIAFPKDLATMRNPQSPFTFFSYLHEQGRMVDFINHQTFFPSRQEFGDYLSWAARKVDADVRYGTRAESIEFVDDLVVVTCRGPQGVVELRGRNVIFAPGLSQRLPAGITSSERIFHNHRILEQLPRVPSAPNGSFAVLGAGQSAAEVVEYLHDSYPAAEVHMIHAKFGMTPADDSPFANRVFDPATVDLWHGAAPEIRSRMLDYHRGTNYSAVDGELLAELYRREYQEKVAGARRMFIHNSTVLAEAIDEPDGVTVRTRDLMTGEESDLRVDALVCATGFVAGDIRDLLGASSDLVEVDATGTPVVERDYRLRTVDSVRAGVYLNGGVEATHGLSSTLLSNIAIRSGEILASVRQHAAQRVG